MKILGVVSAGAGCAWLFMGCHTAPPQRATPEVAVLVLRPEPAVLTAQLPGRTVPYLVAEIRPQVSGIIQKRLFEEGAEVTAGSTLYQIDPTPYQAALGQAEAALKSAEANAPALQSRADRTRRLAESRAVGQQEADEAQAASLTAQAGVASAKAALENAKFNLANTPIKAPITGRTGLSTVTVGALVTAYQPVFLTTVQQLDPIFVDVTQSSADLLRLRRRMESGHLKSSGGASRVKLLQEDGTAYPLEGKLKFRDVTVDPATGAVTLRMVFPNPGHVLLPGMFVRAVVEEGVDDKAILAPQQGVSRNTKGEPVAWILDAADKVEQRTLTVDKAVGDRWLVTSGLAAGDRLIVEGLQKVRPGMPAKAVPFAAPATKK